MSARRVIVESPYAGDVARNVAYARLACWWLLKQGMAPFASHLLYTQMLDDRDGVERELGMGAGMSWRHGAEQTFAFTDFGISGGMKAGIAHAHKHGQEVRTVLLREEMGEEDFEFALDRFRSRVQEPTIDHPSLSAPVDPTEEEFEAAQGEPHEPQIGGA